MVDMHRGGPREQTKNNLAIWHRGKSSYNESSYTFKLHDDISIDPVDQERVEIKRFKLHEVLDVRMDARQQAREKNKN